jgi:hypothetical protein
MKSNDMAIIGKRLWKEMGDRNLIIISKHFPGETGKSMKNLIVTTIRLGAEICIL